MGLESNRKFVSRVAGELKAISKDGRISRRLILSIGKDKANLLMSQKYDEMTLFKEDSIISYIPCFPMCEVLTKECDIFEFRLCESVMKSKHKLPKTISGKNGAGITLVTNMDNSIVYDYVTPQRYLSNKKRKFADTNVKYFTIKDGYLYLPNSTNELIEIYMIAINQWEIEEVSDCSSIIKSCISRWDYDFICPDRLYESVLTNTIQELAASWANIVQDTNPNLDPNLKTKTSR